LGGYPVPAATHRVEETIRRSRFITTVARAGTPEAARAFVAAVRQEFPDATHNCWAFVAGPPGDSGQVGMSDDGEPHGTAGRPMLTALLHGGVGEVAAVVTRYYGGVKLGKGGLGRAYAGGVVAALETLPTELLVPTAEVTVELRHADVTGARRIFLRLGVTVLDEAWGEGIAYRLRVPEPVMAELASELGGLTRGRAEVKGP
jgi:uncharacterized YigZ family protein